MYCVTVPGEVPSAVTAWLVFLVTWRLLLIHSLGVALSRATVRHCCWGTPGQCFLLGLEPHLAPAEDGPLLPYKVLAVGTPGVGLGASFCVISAVLPHETCFKGTTQAIAPEERIVFSSFSKLPGLQWRPCVSGLFPCTPHTPISFPNV